MVYWRFFNLAFQVAFSYRASIIARAIRDFLMVLFFIALWRALYVGQSVISGFTFPAMVSYYVLVKVVDQLYTFDAGNQLEKHVKTGELSNFLSRPFNYLLYLITFIFGRRLARTTVTIIASLIIFILFPSLVNSPAGAVNFVFFLLAVICAWILMFSLSFFAGLISFWTTETAGLRQGFELLILVLGGLWVPLNTLPSNVYSVVNALPFKYLYYFPVQVYLGRVDLGEIIIGLCWEMVWAFGLLLTSKYIFRLGLRKFGAYGG